MKLWRKSGGRKSWVSEQKFHWFVYFFRSHLPSSPNTSSGRVSVTATCRVSEMKINDGGTCWIWKFWWLMVVVMDENTLGDGGGCGTLFFQSKKSIMFCHNMMTHKKCYHTTWKRSKYENTSFRKKPLHWLLLWWWGECWFVLFLHAFNSPLIINFHH